MCFYRPFFCKKMVVQLLLNCYTTNGIIYLNCSLTYIDKSVFFFPPNIRSIAQYIIRMYCYTVIIRRDHSRFRRFRDNNAIPNHIIGFSRNAFTSTVVLHGVYGKSLIVSPTIAVTYKWAVLLPQER